MWNDVVWASKAPADNVKAPATDKQETGWIKEFPPFEWFNWYMNRTDKRLQGLEVPRTAYEYFSGSNTRGKELPAKEKIQLPGKYIVGTHQLKVYLDGILCEEGEDKQYVESGQYGELSDYIRFNDAINNAFEIRVEIPMHTFENIGLINAEVVSVEELQKLFTEYALLDYKLGCESARKDDKSREADLAVNATYEVPEYTVGGHNLEVYVDGALCTVGVDYKEAEGDDYQKATSITWLKAVAKDKPIACITHTINATVIGDV